MDKYEGYDQEFPIHDLYIANLATQEFESGFQYDVLSRCDHLLRRFGQISFLTLGPSGKGTLERNAIADEIWALQRGDVIFHWNDRRENSPTKGAAYKARFDSPSLALVPFGVSFSFEWKESGTMLIRISSEEKSSDTSPVIRLE
jgi:hypothetical protein